MKKSLKIAIYSGAVPSTTFIERLIHGISMQGHQIFLFGLQKKTTIIKNNIHYFTFSNRISKFFHLLKYSFLLSIFKSNEKKELDNIIVSKRKNTRLLKVKYYPVLYHCPDIFHLQWAKSIEDWMWVQKFGIKLVVSLRGAHINYSPIVDTQLANNYKKFFPKVDGFHGVSRAIATESTKYNAAKNNIHVIYSGLDLLQMPFKLKKFYSKSLLKIVSVGRSHWIKGYSYALKSLHQLKCRGIDFQYTIIGVANNEELLYLRKQLELEKEVIFINKLPFKKVMETMQDSSILLLPSIEEGIANVVIEAMALGTLVISTNCGGMNEVIVDAKNGFLVPIRDAKSMALAIEKASDLTLSSYQEITKNARMTIEKQHCHKKMISKIEAFYLSIENS